MTKFRGALELIPHRSEGHLTRTALQIKRHAEIVLLFIIGLHVLLDNFYRPIQFKSGNFDFGFAGSFTQITASMGTAMLMIIHDAHKLEDPVALKGQINFYSFVPVFAMAGYELLQIWYPIATFDRTDLIYCLIAFVLCFCTVRLVVFSSFRAAISTLSRPKLVTESALSLISKLIRNDQP